MCGIVGLYGFNRPVDPEELDRFTDSMTHRGPDGRGVYRAGEVGLGHRRLAILDLSEAGRCPMCFEAPGGAELWVTFNGEIYNFLELRRELEECGYRFSTQTDTEVIMAAYHRWGEECLGRFNGMWAFALWDPGERKLLLARDRFGIKPLYYVISGGRIAFASELKAFLSLDGFSPSLNEPLTVKVLQNTEPWEGATDETLLSGVRRLPGGAALTVDRQGRVSIRKWWETSDHIPDVPKCYEEQVERFRELFLDAVRLRMRSDVPIGTCLSGGIDSSAVASAMAWNHGQTTGAGLERCASDWQRTFVATFPGSRLDEKDFADEVIRAVGAKPHYLPFNGEDAVKCLLDSIWAVEFVHGTIAAPVWMIYRKMRSERVLVSLDGHGGDELLAGYAGYLDWPMGKVNENLYNDFHYLMLPSILRNYDRCSMAHGIEVRMPLLDWRLVTFAFALAPEAKLGGGFTKRILRDAMKGIMPETIRTRRSKVGFNAPMIEWFNGAMKPVVEAVLNHRLWLGSPFWDGPGLRRAILDRMKEKPWGYEDWGEVFNISVKMSLVVWQLQFVERTREGLM